MQVKYVIIPIATISCGKTTTFKTLANLFPSWAHVENDNISKSRKKQLVKIALTRLNESDVVLVDKNNSEFKNRTQLLSDFEAQKHKYLVGDVELRYIAVNFIKDSLDNRKLWDITHRRTKSRGDNHQTIKYETRSGFATMIMRTFIKSLQRVDPTSLPDSQFDLIIDLDIVGRDSSLSNAKSIISKLIEKYPGLISEPSDQSIEAAFKKALVYEAEPKKLEAEHAPE